MKNTALPILLSIFILGFQTVSFSQSLYKIIDSKSIAMKLSGTSTLHNWIMNAQMVTGEAQFNIAKMVLKSVSALTFTLPVEALKSGEKAMDNNAYEALKSTIYKNISFTLTSSKVQSQQNNTYPISAIGNLSIAGITKEIRMMVYCHLQQDTSIVCTGSQKLNMTDYQVKPPTFLLGAMKTGDEIVLDFYLLFQK